MSITINERFQAKLSSLLDAGLEGRLYEEPAPNTGSLTIGDYANENAALINFGIRGGHIVRAFESVNPDIMLCYQSKMVAFNILTDSSEALRPVGKTVKSLLYRDPHLNIKS